jgi:membrane protease YdiL (CAAX protease family)
MITLTDAREGERTSKEAWARLIALLVVAALMPWPLLLGPNNWRVFVLVTAAIVVALRLVLGRQWKRYAGLNLRATHLLIAIAVFALVATGSTILLHHVYEMVGLRANAPPIEGQIGFLFQAFNEEILFRALLIGFIVQFIRSAPVISLGAAFLFATAHFLLYRFSNPMHLALSITALATLFLAGVAMNNLYLAFRHIGFSWALHAGWNVVWLPATIYDVASDERLYEPQVFNRVLGSPTIAAIACGIAVLSFVFVVRHPLTSSANI